MGDKKMRARDVMTTNVITVTSRPRVDEIARLLLKRRISAVPVVGEDGAIVGIVSEADMLRRPEIETERHRPWWLMHLARREKIAEEQFVERWLVIQGSIGR